MSAIASLNLFSRLLPAAFSAKAQSLSRLDNVRSGVTDFVTSSDVFSFQNFKDAGLALVVGSSSLSSDGLLVNLAQVAHSYLRPVVLGALSFIPAASLAFAGTDLFNCVANFRQGCKGEGLGNFVEAAFDASRALSTLVPGGRVAAEVISRAGKLVIKRAALAKTIAESPTRKSLDLIREHRFIHRIAANVSDEQVLLQLVESSKNRKYLVGAYSTNKSNHLVLASRHARDPRSPRTSSFLNSYIDTLKSANRRVFVTGLNTSQRADNSLVLVSRFPHPVIRSSQAVTRCPAGMQMLVAPSIREPNLETMKRARPVRVFAMGSPTSQQVDNSLILSPRYPHPVIIPSGSSVSYNVFLSRYRANLPLVGEGYRSIIGKELVHQAAANAYHAFASFGKLARIPSTLAKQA